MHTAGTVFSQMRQTTGALDAFAVMGAAAEGAGVGAVVGFMGESSERDESSTFSESHATNVSFSLSASCNASE
jgi:hypothetical protein